MRAIETLCYILVAIFTIVYAVKGGIKIHDNHEYQRTDEYKLIELGYTKEDTKVLLSKLKKEQITFVLDNDYNKDYIDIVSNKFFKDKYFNDYVEYKLNHKTFTSDETVAVVNTHVNKGWYNEEYVSQTYNDLLVIANKFYKLPDDYNRDDIVNVSLSYSYAGNKASKIVIESFEKMYDDIYNDLGVHLMINSSYRSYEAQERVYNGYKSTSLAYADNHAARPGHSEHQTGLVLNISSKENPTDTFDDSDEFKWLLDNSYKYGFIQRYPADKNYITGFNETWLFRYVGPEVAKIIHDEGITFDEYYAFYLEK